MIWIGGEMPSGKKSSVLAQPALLDPRDCKGEEGREGSLQLHKEMGDQCFSFETSQSPN